MRIVEITSHTINEQFEWNSQFDDDRARQLGGMIKFNDGLFKSDKQAAFLFGDRSPLGLRTDFSSADLKRLFNVEAGPDEKVLSLDGWMTFAPGARGTRPITWYYVIDKFGVVKKYKLGYVGDMKAGTQPDPGKTKLLWTRPAGLDTSHLEVDPDKPAEPRPGDDSEHIGEVGKREAFTGKVLFTKGLDTEWGHTLLTKFITPEGNLITVFGGNWVDDPQKGDSKTFVGTVKKHDEYQGVKQTLLNRVKEKSNNESMVEEEDELDHVKRMAGLEEAPLPPLTPRKKKWVNPDLSAAQAYEWEADNIERTGDALGADDLDKIHTKSVSTDQLIADRRKEAKRLAAAGGTVGGKAYVPGQNRQKAIDTAVAGMRGFKDQV